MRLLEKEEIQAGVAAANEKGDEEQASKSFPGGGGWPWPVYLGPLLAYVLDNANSHPAPSPTRNFTLHALCPLHTLEGHIEGKIMTSCYQSGLGSFWGLGF